MARGRKKKKLTNQSNFVERDLQAFNIPVTVSYFVSVYLYYCCWFFIGDVFVFLLASVTMLVSLSVKLSVAISKLSGIS